MLTSHSCPVIEFKFIEGFPMYFYYNEKEGTLFSAFTAFLRENLLFIIFFLLNMNTGMGMHTDRRNVKFAKYRDHDTTIYIDTNRKSDI